MDARQLSYFLAVVEHMNFGRVAQQLHIAQPSPSQAIVTFEREPGVPLFHRVGRGIVLSDAGARLVELARQVLRADDVDPAAQPLAALALPPRIATASDTEIEALTASPDPAARMLVAERCDLPSGIRVEDARAGRPPS
ncbi:LysR family transcriptional regulator [Streptosporangium sp. LJ11]|uniref:LysR family transcriptional regulator n=1 Tax=Streptosporangium sp. LJ11 TaxID=3436927 RepID=UPI003F796340